MEAARGACWSEQLLAGAIWLVIEGRVHPAQKQTTKH